MGSDGLRLGVLDLLDDGLEPSTEGSSLGVIRHGDRTRQRTGDGGCTMPRLGLAEAKNRRKKLRLLYRVSGEELRRNALVVLNHRVYNI
jgi:hypothetical protein